MSKIEVIMDPHVLDKFGLSTLGALTSNTSGGDSNVLEKTLSYALWNVDLTFSFINKVLPPLTSKCLRSQKVVATFFKGIYLKTILCFP